MNICTLRSAIYKKYAFPKVHFLKKYSFSAKLPRGITAGQKIISQFVNRYSIQ